MPVRDPRLFLQSVEVSPPGLEGVQTVCRHRAVHVAEWIQKLEENVRVVVVQGQKCLDDCADESFVRHVVRFTEMQSHGEDLAFHQLRRLWLELDLVHFVGKTSLKAETSFCSHSHALVEA